ncbi:MAG: DMT family transporter [Oscillospiraceae bacterium]|nr:DMT family transporter [Oscillospiraceae bacterium]
MRAGKNAMGHLMAFLCVLAWGTSFLASKSLMESFSAVQLMWLRFLVAYIVMWILHPKWRFCLKEEGMFFLISLFANTLYFLAENTALQLTQTSNVSILVTTAPIFTAVLLRLGRDKVRITARQAAGFAIALLGVVLVVLNGVFRLRLSPAGDLLSLAAALSWAVYGVIAAPYAQRFNGFFITRKLMFYGLLSTTPLLILDPHPFDLGALRGPEALFSLLYLGVVCSACCYIMWNRAMRDIGVLTANIYIYVIPVVTLLAGAALMEETVTALGAAGIAIVIFGMAISNVKKKA